MSEATEKVLSTLKDFQRDTVDYAFQRLWTDKDWTKRFLVADEVGLGKTMVAKGVIAKTVDHLWDIEDRIDIIYICSNTQIARQNLSRLNQVGGTELRHADRLTLLPKVIKDLRQQKVNFVSFTPGTSFSVGQTGGAYPERVMLYWMLAECWGRDAVYARRWRRFFQGAVSESRFEWYLDQFDRSALDAELVASFGSAVAAEIGPNGGPLRDELEECVDKFNYLRREPDRDLRWRRDRLIGLLRHLVARAAVEHLEPDLVILDEFQRFKDVLDGEGYGADLAREVFDHPKARVLLLSATPFKMYTLPDEPAGDDHYEDFNRTIEFLAGKERSEKVRRDLRSMRDAALAGPPTPEALAARDRVESELKRVMARTERLASTPDRDGMLEVRKFEGNRLDVEDVRSWVTFDGVARALDRNDVFEYWRSTPYPLNLMERNSYQVRKHFEAAVDRDDRDLTAALDGAQGLLDWQDIAQYRQIDPGNAKLRGLFQDVLDREAWRLAWLPPSLPYYTLGGAYAMPELRTFTKRLIFSAWAVVPKAIAVMTSYEAERRTIADEGAEKRTYEEHKATSPPLQYRVSGTTVALMYPSLVLAKAGDPLAIARESGELPMDRNVLIGRVRDRVDELLTTLAVASPESGPTDSRWYVAAPALLDRMSSGRGNADAVALMRALQRSSAEDVETRLDAHLDLIIQLDGLEAGGDASALGLGAQPSDLAEVLTDLAIGGPGVNALRALSRVCGGPSATRDPHVRAEAFRIALGLRSLFNKPEIVSLLRSDDREAYWRAVARHGIDGCLQAVLDEYAHTLVESEGLQGADSGTRASTIAEAMADALSIRTANNNVEDVRVADGRVTVSVERASSHFAARYGRAQSADSAIVRESTVRAAYNSPFRPFVLASTSVGQEGLDFHTYSHAIVHWNLPGNPVDLEQREGRVHRYKGHAVRKNVATAHSNDVLSSIDDDPWAALFDAAVASRPDADSEIIPFWVFAPDGGAKIERYVPALPLSRELQHYGRLRRTVGTYRMLLGQPRQDDLIESLGEGAAWMAIDLAPPGS